MVNRDSRTGPESEPESSEQHNREIYENRAHWERKPVLRAIYSGFYSQIARVIAHDVPGASVELGSGMGNIKRYLPDCVTTDLFPNPWLDRVENAYALSFADASLANLIMFDVLHHLQFLGRAFDEAARVVKPGGRVIVFDHDMGLLPRWICGIFHHEPRALNGALEWDAPDDFRPDQASYYAATGNAHRLFNRRELEHSWAKQWRLVQRVRLSSFAWLGCGGLRGPQLYPDFMLPAVNLLDRACHLCPALFAARMLVVLERRH